MVTASMLAPPIQPPKNWMRAELESKELLTFCVKKVKGLNKVRRLRHCATASPCRGHTR